MKTKTQINRALKQLRRLVEDEKAEPVARRVAYEAEHAIRWATQKTVGWPLPVTSVKETARLIHQDLS